MAIKRRKFQGVLNILSFNRHFYMFGFAVFALLIVSYIYFPWYPGIFWLIISGFIYGLLAPLFVSAYVYDFSGFYKFDWLAQVTRYNQTPSLIVNINAGFDETSFILHDKFPNAVLRVFDFYDAKRHTEPAIKRARKVSNVFPGNERITSHCIPLPAESVDLVFLLSAAHEIRSHNEKVLFLEECRRICKPGGRTIMVEHLRDLPNFLAFTIGFTHFFSHRVWRSALKKAGFTTFEKRKFTPFMSIFTAHPY